MHSKSNIKINIPLRITAILFALVLITTNLLAGMYARFTTVGINNDGGRTAAFVFDVKDEEGSFLLDLTEIKQPGDKQTYSFVISNTKDGVSGEVAQKFTVSLSELGSLPLTYKYISDNNGDITEHQPVEASSSESVKVFTDYSDVEALPVTYTVEIEWPESENDEKYSSGSGIAHLKIDIQCEQID